MKQYTKEEIEILNKYYFKEGVKGVQKYINRSKDSIRHKAKAIGIKREDGFRENQKDFDYLMHPKTEIAAYLLGLIWGDGTISIAKNNKGYRTSVTLQEQDFFELKEKGVFENFHIHKVKKMQESWKQTYCASIGHKKLTLYLKSKDFNIKSITTPNKILQIIPKKFHCDFIRGWFDADGCSNSLRKTGYTVSIAGAFKQNWAVLRRFCNNNGVLYYVRSRKTENGNSSCFFVSGKQNVVKFLNLLYKSEPYLNRKYENYSQLVKRINN